MGGATASTGYPRSRRPPRSRPAMPPETAIPCDACENSFTYYWGLGEDRKLQQVEEQMRVRGWHIWRGTLHSGKYVTVRLCKSCAGSHRVPAPQVLEGQLDLFEEGS